LFLMATLAVTGTPPFGLFQSEFTALSAALAAGRGWAALLFVAGVVTIFAGFLIHLSQLSLGKPRSDAPARVAESLWKLSAMGLVAVSMIILGCWLPGPLYRLIQQSVLIIGGAS
jgi:hydrogenase-4 component F